MHLYTGIYKYLLKWQSLRSLKFQVSRFRQIVLNEVKQWSLSLWHTDKSPYIGRISCHAFTITSTTGSDSFHHPAVVGRQERVGGGTATEPFFNSLAFLVPIGAAKENEMENFKTATLM